MLKKEKKVRNIFLDYEDKWVVLDSKGKKVWVSGSTIKELYRNLDKKGIDPKELIITRVPHFDRAFSPQCH